MFTNFEFVERDFYLVGYHFPCENATHVMCIVHGVGEYAQRYQRMADYLNSRGIAVIAMDLRGHGRSEGKRGDAAPRYEILKDVDALLDYADEFYPDIPVTLYGHSMGGNIVLDYLMRGEDNDEPVSYIISAPWVKLVKPCSAPLHSFLKFMAKINQKMLINSKCDEEDLGNPEYVRPYVDDEYVHSHITVRCTLDCLDVADQLAKGTLFNNHKADGKPLLLMQGTDDKICSAEGARIMAENFKDREDFRYIEWPGYYHEIHNGGPNATGDKVIETIADYVLKY